MGLQKVALNFMVEHGEKLVKSSQCSEIDRFTEIESLKINTLKKDGMFNKLKR